MGLMARLLQTVAVTMNHDETVTTGPTLSVSAGSVGDAAGATPVSVTVRQ